MCKLNLEKWVLNKKGIKLDCNYNNKKSPLILDLEKTYPDLAELVYQLTRLDSSNRGDFEFRNKIRLELMPSLPYLSDIPKVQATFLHRVLNKHDVELYGELIQDQTFILQNSFTSFYLNGQSVGGLTNGGNVSWICESLDDGKYLGSLSQVPEEKEILIKEGKKYKVLNIFNNIHELINSTELRNDTKEFLSKCIDEPDRGMKYFLLRSV